ncbi:hypothetical protein TNIN_76381 [Trichonephila inaurata madagascariensis]|uniref:Uncharacterized protein n=1 Tax=Trichonephila inaurata madagascariensis TaxID=2747483 RepID=A0A8X6XMK9_9ARAC|nr:hypothetical protein TNIN_76381 [Trichonephila inaurata madagascariensis]
MPCFVKKPSSLNRKGNHSVRHQISSCFVTLLNSATTDRVLVDGDSVSHCNTLSSSSGWYTLFSCPALSPVTRDDPFIDASEWGMQWTSPHWKMLGVHCNRLDRI